MRIGILGSGLMGAKLGTLFARAGHDVVFSYARSESKLKRLAREAKGNARAGTPADAARDADAMLLAVHWSRVRDVLTQAGDVSGKVILSCVMPMNEANTRLVVGRATSAAESREALPARALRFRLWHDSKRGALRRLRVGAPDEAQPDVLGRRQGREEEWAS